MEELVCVFKRDQELPEPGKVISLQSALAGRKLSIKVKVITKIKFNRAGDLVVHFKGKQIKTVEEEAK